MREPIPTALVYLGSVAAFDAARGLGTVTDAQGRSFDFHATAIVDGTRQIAPGTEVSFVVVPGHLGRFEARALTVRRGDAPS